MASPSYEVAIYNADQKELVGVFKTMKICSKYIFEGKSITYHKAKLHDNVNRRMAIEGTRFENEFRVVIRPASKIQLERLDKEPLIIESNYPKPKSKNSYVIS